MGRVGEGQNQYTTEGSVLQCMKARYFHKIGTDFNRVASHKQMPRCRNLVSGRLHTPACCLTNSDSCLPALARECRHLSVGREPPCGPSQTGVSQTTCESARWRDSAVKKRQRTDKMRGLANKVEVVGGRSLG